MNKVGVFISKGYLIVIVHESNGKHRFFSSGLKVGNITKEQKRKLFKFVLGVFYSMEEYNYHAFKERFKARLLEHILKSFD